MNTVIETCPKCGEDLTSWIISTYPPIEVKQCKCGWRWQGESFIRRIPFEPPKEEQDGA